VFVAGERKYQVKVVSLRLLFMMGKEERDGGDEGGLLYSNCSMPGCMDGRNVFIVT